MEKVWYIYFKNHHRGPFSKTEILNFLLQKRITFQTQLWREGQKRWLGMGSIPEFSFDGALPLPRKPKIPKSKGHQSQLNQNQISRYHFFHQLAQHPSYQSRNFKLTLIGCGLTFSMVTCFVGVRKFSPFDLPLFPRPQLMEEYDYLQLSSLKKDLKKEKSGKNKKPVLVEKVELTFSKDKSRLWLASNVSATFPLKIRFTSIPKKILSFENITFQAETLYENHLAEFKDFQLVKGTKIVPGYYRMELDFPYARRQVLALQQKEMLFGKISTEQLSTQLASYWRQVEEAQSQYSLDLQEKYDTLWSLAEMIEQIFIGPMANLSSTKEIDGLVERYSREIAPLLRDLTLDNQKVEQELNPYFKAWKKEYGRLADIGKKMGQLVADAIDEFKSKGTFSSEEKDHLLKKYSGEINLLKSQLAEKGQSLEKDKK